MNKKVKFILLGLCTLLVGSLFLFNMDGIKADSGWDVDFDTGGSSWGGSSDWGSSDWDHDYSHSSSGVSGSGSSFAIVFTIIVIVILFMPHQKQVIQPYQETFQIIHILL